MHLRLVLVHFLNLFLDLNASSSSSCVSKERSRNYVPNSLRSRNPKIKLHVCTELKKAELLRTVFAVFLTKITPTSSHPGLRTAAFKSEKKRQFVFLTDSTLKDETFAPLLIVFLLSHWRTLQLSLDLQHHCINCEYVSACMRFFCSLKDYVTSHPLTFLYSLVATLAITPSTPVLRLPLLSAPFAQTQMIDGDLRKHGRGMALAVGF